MDAGLEKSALMHIARLKNSLAKGLKRMVTKGNEQRQRTGRLVLDAYATSARQLGCVFQDMEPPKSSSILRMSTDIRKPIRFVKFMKSRRTSCQHSRPKKKPSLGVICPGEPHQRNPNAPKFEDRSQERTEWQERCAREAA